MNTIYGNTLDSLMANEVAAQRADQAERNAYRNYLAQVAQTNLQRLRNQDIGENERGMLGVHQQDASTRRLHEDNMDKYNTGRLGIDQQDAGTRWAAMQQAGVRDANQFELGKQGIGLSWAELERRNNQDERNQYNTIEGWNHQLRLARTPAPMSDLDKWRTENPILSGLGYDQNTKAMAGLDSADRTNAANAIPGLQSQLEQSVNRIMSGAGWFNSPEYKSAVAAAGPNATPEQIKKAAYTQAWQALQPTLKNSGLNPAVINFNEGRLSVGQSPYARSMQQVAPTPAAGTNAAPSAKSAPVIGNGQGVRRVFNPSTGTSATMSPSGEMQGSPEAPSQPASIQPTSQPTVAPDSYGPPDPASSYQSRLMQLQGMESKPGGRDASAALTTPFYAGVASALKTPPQQFGDSTLFKHPRSVVADNWSQTKAAFDALPDDVKNGVYLKALEAAQNVTSPRPSFLTGGGFSDRALPSFDWIYKQGTTQAGVDY